MSILLAQLGDIHFEKANDPAVERAILIGAAIAAELTVETTSVVLALCGDATYSGTKAQFTIVQQFVEAVEAAIRDRCTEVKIIRVVIPGNHDCDFSGDQAARDGLLGLINESAKPAESITKVVLEPLMEYFKFAKEFVGDENAIAGSHQFYNSVDIRDGDSILRLHLLNTAWMSSLHEKPGSLHFPLAEILPPTDHADCSFAILHHPTNWFSQPHAMRPLRDRMSDLASVVLVNHEHTPEAREEAPLMDRDGTATKTIYVSGGVVQEWEKKELCSFNILTLDVLKKLLRLTRHEFRKNEGQPFFERTGVETVGISANELWVGPAGASLEKAMIAFLDDPGAPISHPNRDPRIPVRLCDIFLYPDLWELDADHDGSDQKQIRSHKVAEEILATEKALVTGGEKSGRSAFAKSLFMAAFDAGRIPIYLAGEEVPKTTDKLRKKIRESVTKQYSNLSPDRFEQLKRSDRVVLVDDVHRMAPATIARKEILQELERQFGTVVLCGDDLIKLDEMSGTKSRDSGLWEYRHLIILGFGELLRENSFNSG